MLCLSYVFYLSLNYQNYQSSNISNFSLSNLNIFTCSHLTDLFSLSNLSSQSRTGSTYLVFRCRVVGGSGCYGNGERRGHLSQCVNDVESTASSSSRTIDALRLSVECLFSFKDVDHLDTGVKRSVVKRHCVSD